MNPGGEGDGSMVIRPMLKADLARVLEIASALSHAPHWPTEVYQRALDPTALPRRIALVAEGPNLDEVPPGGPLVAGFAVAGVIPPQAEIETIAVAIEGQRRGVGRLLLSAILQELRSLDVTEVLLEARESNHPALGLYSSLGFERTGVRTRYYADPEEDAVLMALRIL
jgi:ribosomal-protein-alanine N-acetyltransferase